MKLISKIIIVSVIGLISVFTQKAYSQNTKSGIVKLQKEFKKLSYDDTVFNLSYIEEKHTFIFSQRKNQNDLVYRVIVTDIHPNGIYFEECNSDNNYYLLKLISIDDGSRFIKIKKKNQMINQSETTNLIEFPVKGRKKKIKKFISTLKEFLRKKDSKDDEIILISPNNK